MKNKLYVISENDKALENNFGKQGIYWNYKSAVKKLGQLKQKRKESIFKIIQYGRECYCE